MRGIRRSIVAGGLVGEGVAGRRGPGQQGLMQGSIRKGHQERSIRKEHIVEGEVVGVGKQGLVQASKGRGCR
jgi:hypothetical protein